MVIILTNLTVFSQTGTNNPDVKCFPNLVAKKIAQDLLRGDSALTLLKLTEDHLKITEEKNLIQSNSIEIYKEKEKNYIKIIDLEREKYSTLEDFNNSLQIELKKQKIKSKISSMGTITAGVCLLVSFIFLK